MKNFESSFKAVFEKLLTIDYSGESGPAFPFEIPPTPAAVAAAMQQGANCIPYVFRTAYADPLERSLGALMQQSQTNRALLETLTGALYQHSQPELLQPLQRLLAVISDLFRSFLSNKRRAAVDIPLVEAIPPLAMFQRDGSSGPFTYTCSDVQRYTGATVGVVSIPASYREHPLLWSTLAHETGGHDVIHADAALLPELEEGVKGLFGGGPKHVTRSLGKDQALALLWSYWMEEASADVYAALNMGPAFGLNLAAYFSAVNAQAGKTSKPVLRASSGFNPTDPTHSLDIHPPDLLRLALIKGVVESLESLSSDSRSAWITKLDALIEICGQGAASIQVAGVIADAPGVHIPIELSMSLSVMLDSARKAGAWVASAKLKALGGKNIQDLETWDDADEDTAQKIGERYAKGLPVAGYGDDAQVLAGANLAVFEFPADYAKVTKGLELALDISFNQDPYWAKMAPDCIADFHCELSLKGTGLTPFKYTGVK